MEEPMKFSNTALFAMVLAAHSLFSANILWEVAIIEDYDCGDNIDHVLWCGAEGAGFSLGLYYSNAVDMWGNVFEIVNPDARGGASCAMNIVRMRVGETVSAKTARGEQPYIYSNWMDYEPGYDGGSPETSPVFLYPNEEVFMGFATPGWVPLGEDPKYCYGWFSLIFDGTDVRVGQSAMDLSGGPIIIQPRSIPEPGAAALLAIGTAMLLASRRRGITRV